MIKVYLRVDPSLLNISYCDMYLLYHCSNSVIFSNISCISFASLKGFYFLNKENECDNQKKIQAITGLMVSIKATKCR